MYLLNHFIFSPDQDILMFNSFDEFRLVYTVNGNQHLKLVFYIKMESYKCKVKVKDLVVCMISQAASQLPATSGVHFAILFSIFFWVYNRGGLFASSDFLTFLDTQCLLIFEKSQEQNWKWFFIYGRSLHVTWHDASLFLCCLTGVTN